MIELNLPFPPSINNYYQRNRNGGVRIGKAGVLFRAQVKMLIPSKLRTFSTYAVSVEIDVYPPDKRKRDLDNILKALLDAMEHAGIYKNDSQICRLLIERMEAEPPAGRVVVRVEPYERKTK